MSGDVFPAITEEYVDNLFNYQEKTYNFPLFRSGKYSFTKVFIMIRHTTRHPCYRS